MAYELALMTFHYVPEVQNVAVLMPPLVKGQKARILVLARADEQGSEVAHVSARLCPARPAKTNLVSQREAEMIAKRTDPLIYLLRGHGDQRQPAAST